MTENKCEFCNNKITSHYSFTYICDNCRGIIKRLKKYLAISIKQVVLIFGENWDSDEPMDSAKGTPAYAEIKSLQKILGVKK